MKLFILVVPVPDIEKFTPDQVRLSAEWGLDQLSNEEIIKSLVDVPEGDGALGLLVTRDA